MRALLQRIDRLESRHQIAELVGNYARACDEHDIDTLAAIYTEDGVIDSPSKLLAAEGRQGIREGFLRRYKIRGPSYHWTHDHKVAFDDADPDQVKACMRDGVLRISVQRKASSQPRRISIQ